MKENRARITQVLAIACLAVFALCILLVLLTAGSVYRNLVDRGEETYTRRTALQYLTTRVHQAQTVDTGTWEDCEVLILGEIIDGERYTTRVYCYEGWLRELYAAAGAVLPPTAGEPIVEVETFALKQEEDLLTVTFDEDILLLYLPAGRTVGP